MIKNFVVMLMSLFLGTYLFPAKIVDLLKVIQPEQIRVEGDDLFIVELKDLTILVYSLKTNKLKFKVGGKGEGPGEYKWRPRIPQITKDHFLVTADEKCLWYDRNGKLKKEHVLSHRFFDSTPVKNNYVLYKSSFQGRLINKVLRIVDSNFENPKVFHTARMDWTRRSPNDPPSTEYKMIRHYFTFAVADDKIFVVNTNKGFIIDVFDSNGKALYTIDKTKDIAPVPIGEDYKKRVLKIHKIRYPHRWRQLRPSSFTFYKNFPAMKSIRIDDKKIYVATYNVNKDGFNELIVLDLKGTILNRIFLPFKSMQFYRSTNSYNPFTFHKGILYELVDIEEEVKWELHKTDVSHLK